MNYKKVYDQIIQNRLTNKLSRNQYTERHHIMPKCLGGTDDESNLVRLTAREHFICHALLAEMYEKGTNEWYRMNNAFMMMRPSPTRKETRYFNSRLYELKRKDFSTTMKYLQSGEKNSQFGKVWVYNVSLKKNTKVPKIKLEYYIQEGWTVGRIYNFNKLNKKPVVKKVLKFNDRVVTRSVLKNLRNIFRIKKCTGLEILLKVKEILYDQYVVQNMSTTQLAKYYDSTDPTIRKYLLWLGIGTKNRGGKWVS